ncbi:MORN domain-containing protein [Naegleria gruberi]|uniref:MORN domain-containing protein n=1 Tax=Naegleria gruberi TaxID=5762 RepID=D2V9C0_NAEGR|nr:MORN domain-containing protein [Naegleria gruberi]EFC46566.1 MORN domain-containing protein [Naegleria gruberi]|eukprot:XP_002679310.1 MORN domain-containing protein [Naegleria gruberi strain NEG-M]
MSKDPKKKPVAGKNVVPEEEKTGKALFYYNDDIIYDGEWMLNEETNQKQKHGFGIYKDGSNVYEGHFENDLMHGKGKMSWANGSQYEGDFVKGLMEGNGIYTWPNKTQRYEGTWVNNKMHGRGRFTSDDGKVWKGYFYNGKGENLERELAL